MNHHSDTSTPSAPIGELLQTDAAGAYLDISPSTLAGWRSLGQGPAYIKMHGVVRYRKRDLDAFIVANLKTAGAA